MKAVYILLLVSSFLYDSGDKLQSCSSRKSKNETANTAKGIITGADQTEKYVSYLKGKRVAILGNPTSVIGKTHLVDSLLKRGITIVKIFGPEHGFRGNASNGAKVQDVGCRFYTNINALVKLMESCAESNKELLILDRPNPNAYFVDGPVLDMKYKSGIGMFPIPITHGLTIAEFAQMANGEGWLQGKATCKLKIITNANYDHSLYYELPVKPSPNLNTQQSVMLYPSLCLFEGTVISQGRGTYFPFTVLGNPELKGKYDFSFTPVSIPGMSETPLHMDKACYGLDLRKYDITILLKEKKLNLQWMMEMYKAYPDKERFFDRTQSKQMGNIDFLAGVAEFKEQIKAGKTEAEIRQSWEPGLSKFKEMRKKYLLYP